MPGKQHTVEGQPLPDVGEYEEVKRYVRFSTKNLTIRFTEESLTRTKEKAAKDRKVVLKTLHQKVRVVGEMEEGEYDKQFKMLADRIIAGGKA